MTRARARRAGERRDLVLDAARTAFFARGYRGTTIQQIADAAGYSKRTVYLDYRNKDELFMTVCAEGGLLLLEKLRAIDADQLDVEQSIERFLEVYVRFSREHRPYFRMIFNESSPEIIANCSPELRASVASVERDCLRVIVDWCDRAIREGIIAPMDPWDTAGIFVGSATGIILLSISGSQTVFSQETLESLVGQAIRAFWRGLRLDESQREGELS